MWLQESLCPRLKTKSNGQVDIVFSMFALLVLVIVVLFESRLSMIHAAGDYVEDALTGALLSSALADVEEYGKTGQIYISDKVRAYGLFRDSLSYNLQLLPGGYSGNEELLYGQLQAVDFAVYNVLNDEVKLYRAGAGGVTDAGVIGTCGEVKTPDGTIVENTTVYGKVGFYVKGLFSDSLYATKEKSVDIVRNEENEDEKK